MTVKSFLIQLSALSAGVALLLFFLNQIPQLQAHGLLSWISLASFVGLSLLMYFVGNKSAKGENKNNFTNVVLGFTMGKMFLSILVIYIYFKLAQPGGKLFILPFFIVYFIFTAFETYFMMKLGKTKI